VFLLPLLSKSKHPHGHSRTRCAVNLKNLSLSARLWASDNGDRYPWETRLTLTNQDGSFDLVTIYKTLSNEMATPKVLACRSDSARAQTNRFEDLSVTNLSYFANLSSSDSRPGAMIFGDRNVMVNGTRAASGSHNMRITDRLTWDRDIHKGEGNVAFVDGSLQMTRKEVLSLNYRTNQPATNLLVFP
jgi:prepilin-type processing-associated H-X9-DG protein